MNVGDIWNAMILFSLLFEFQNDDVREKKPVAYLVLQALDDSLLTVVYVCALVCFCVWLLINKLSFIGCSGQIKDTQSGTSNNHCNGEGGVCVCACQWGEGRVKDAKSHIWNFLVSVSEPGCILCVGLGEYWQSHERLRNRHWKRVRNMFLVDPEVWVTAVDKALWFQDITAHQNHEHDTSDMTTAMSSHEIAKIT